MSSNTIISQFADKAFAGMREFDIQTKGKFIAVCSRKNGKARFFYACDEYAKEGEAEKYLTKDAKFELCAILAENPFDHVMTIFIVDQYLFDLGFRRDPETPENVIMLDAFVDECDEIMRRDFYGKFYEAVEADMDLFDEYYQNNIIDNARWNMMCPSVKYDPLSPPEDLHMEFRHVIKSLCSGDDAGTLIDSFLDSDDVYKKIKLKKSRIEITRRMIHDGKIAAPWEIRMADAIRENDAKTYTVTFSLNGKSASGKIERVKLCRFFSAGNGGNNYMDDWQFVTRPEGKKVFAALGASTSSYRDPENLLHLSNIQSIAYRGKNIYERTEETA